MTERADITVDWALSPRLIEVALPSVIVNNQDLHDTLNSNTLQPGLADDSLENMDDDTIIDSAGKENLGGGVEVGITSTLLDGQVAFGRTAPRHTAPYTITTGSATQFIASGALLQTIGAQRGDWIMNWTDQSVTEILEVLSETTANVRALTGMSASSDDFAVNDVCTVWAVEECELSGGNVVAEDAVAAPINPLFTTFGRFATRAAASQATTQSQFALENAVFGGRVTVDQTNSTGLAVAGTVYPTGTPLQPVNNLADAKVIAAANGFSELLFKGDYTFDFGDNIDAFICRGEGGGLTTLDLGFNTSTVRTRFFDAEVTGDINGAIDCVDCRITSLAGVGSQFNETSLTRCQLEPGTSITLASFPGALRVVIRDCDSGSPGDTPIVLDYNSSTADLVVRKYAGDMRIDNATGTGPSAVDVSFDGDAHVTIDSSCLGGTFVFRGDVKITNNAGVNVTIDDQATYTKLLELWARLGLDPSNPMTTNDDNSVTVGGITIAAVNDPTSTTQTRSGTL